MWYVCISVLYQELWLMLMAEERVDEAIVFLCSRANTTVTKDCRELHCPSKARQR